MTQINRYIFTQVIGIALFVSIVLCVTVALVQSVRLIDLIVNRGLSIASFGWLIVLMSPRLLSYTLPITVFVGVMSVYRRLSAESELTVMKAMGFSNGRLQVPGFLAASLLMLFAYALNLYLVPLSHQSLKAELYKHQSQWSTALVQEGKFTTIGNNITLYVKERSGDILHGLMYDNRENPNDSFTIFAKQGQIIEGAEGSQIVVIDGTRQSLKEGVLQLVGFERTIIEISGKNLGSSPFNRPPEERFLSDLFNPSEQDIAQDGYVAELNAQAHKMLSQPLLLLALTTVAFAVLFRTPYSRGTTIFPVIYASILAGGIIVLHLSAGILAVNFPILNLFIYVIPIMTFFVAGTYSIMPKYWQTSKVEGKQQNIKNNMNSKTHGFAT